MDKNLAITVENITKRYRLSRSGFKVNSVRDIFRYPLENFKRIRRLNKVSNKDEDVHVALDDVSFDVKEGEVLGLIGKNGAGKSTLLKILSKITKPSSGEIKVRGRISSILEVGTGFHEELSGRDNIYMNGTILGMSKKEIDEKLDEIVAFSGIEKHIDKPVKFYSSGMSVRLAFSVAAHLEPDILLIDEVLAVGDLEFQKKCLNKMDDVSTSGRTILFVSHDMAAIEGLCDRCIWLDEGKIRFNGDVQKAIEKYKEHVFEEDNGVSFEDKIDRKGYHNFKFTAIEINQGKVVNAGESCTIKLNYTANQDLKGLHISVKILRSYADVVMAIDNTIQGFTFDVSKGDGSLFINLPHLSLIPNRYIVHLWAGSYFGEEDLIINAAILDIQQSDLYGNGKTLNSKVHGIVATPKCDWNKTEING